MNKLFNMEDDLRKGFSTKADKLKFNAVSSMNYLLLKEIFKLNTFKDTDCAIDQDELTLDTLYIALGEFLEDLTEDALPQDLRQDFINELTDGPYLCNIKSFKHLKDILEHGISYVVSDLESYSESVKLYSNLGKEAIIRRTLYPIALELEKGKTSGITHIYGEDIEYEVNCNLDAYTQLVFSEQGEDTELATKEGCMEFCAQEIYNVKTIEELESIMLNNNLFSISFKGYSSLKELLNF